MSSNHLLVVMQNESNIPAKFTLIYLLLSTSIPHMGGLGDAIHGLTPYMACVKIFTLR